MKNLKAKGKDEWTLLAETAEELNQTLGLEPKIKTTNSDKEDLKDKIKKGIELLTEDDNLSRQTKFMVDELGGDVDFEEPQVVESQDERPNDKNESSLSNKSQVYIAWMDGMTDTDSLHQHVEERIAKNTISSWKSGWKNGNKLPPISEEVGKPEIAE
jgi:hypothetical protein